MPDIRNAAFARAQLDNHGTALNGGKIEIREGPSGTLIASFDLPATAMSAATGTDDTPGTRSISFADLPYSATALASSVDNATDLVALYLNSSEALIFGFDLVTTAADGTGQVLVTGTIGHDSNTKKPIITEGNPLNITVGAFTL